MGGERATCRDDTGRERWNERMHGRVRTSELVDAQELARFGHSLGLENMKHHSNSVYNYRHI